MYNNIRSGYGSKIILGTFFMIAFPTLTHFKHFVYLLDVQNIFLCDSLALPCVYWVGESFVVVSEHLRS